MCCQSFQYCGVERVIDENTNGGKVSNHLARLMAQMRIEKHQLMPDAMISSGKE